MRDVANDDVCVAGVRNCDRKCLARQITKTHQPFTAGRLSTSHEIAGHLGPIQNISFNSQNRIHRKIYIPPVEGKHVISPYVRPEIRRSKTETP